MQLVLWQVTHKFRAHQNTIEATLAITADEYPELTDGTITVSIEASDIKSLTLAEIESMAVRRALEILVK